ncbi:MAG: protein-S-isoprenylcysteine O-methyltransferase [Candidatus Altiarchaeota archaeon]|nr:protein-S-isoprenylcysteine O-methyltransferase [Candidatus Altiarchaeota archaeon]
MNELIWRILFMIFWIGNGLIRMPHNSRYKTTEKIKSKNRLREKFLVLLAGIGLMIMPMVYVFTSWLNSFNMNLPDWIRWIGVICFGFGLALFWWVHKTLGKNWSHVLEIRRNHRLVTQGPYKYVRHPMYTQIWIWAICQWLILSNWVVGVVGVLTWSILYFIRIHEEEKMMIEHFGKEWENYCRRTTKKLVPWVY